MSPQNGTTADMHHGLELGVLITGFSMALVVCMICS